MSYCSQTRDSSRFKICWGWRIQTTYSLRQFPESISSSVCECGVCVVSTHTCMYLPMPTHTEGLCAHSHMACRPLSLSPPYSWSYAGSQPQKFPCLSLPCSVLGFQAPAWPQWLFTWVMRSTGAPRLWSECSYPLSHLSGSHLLTLEILQRSTFTQFQGWERRERAHY